MDKIVLNLKGFLEEVCNFEYDNFIDKINDDVSMFAYNMRIYKEDREDLSKIIKKRGLNISENDIDTVIYEAKGLNYENSYLQEYEIELQNTIEGTLKDSFNNLLKVFKIELKEAGIKVDNKFDIKVDFQSNTLTILNNLEGLDLILLQCLNDYGYHEYTYEEYLSECGENLHNRIEDMIHYLSDFEKCYGTVYDIFIINTEYVDYYGTMGDSSVIEKYVIDALDSI